MTIRFLENFFHASGADAKAPLTQALRAALLCALCILGGCGDVPVAQDLTQRQANEIVSTLHHNGISALASRESGAKGRFYVNVRPSKYSDAVSLITSSGLPGEDKASFNEIIEQRGFMPSSRDMEALRVDHALAAELEELFALHPAVAACRVIVRLNFSRAGSEPGIAVMLQTNQDATISSDEIRKIIERVVPAVKAENVVVSTYSAPHLQTGGSAMEGVINDQGAVIRAPLVPFLFFWRVPDQDYDGIAGVLIFAVLIALAVGGAVAYWWFALHHSRYSFESEGAEITPRHLPADRRRNVEEG